MLEAPDPLSLAVAARRRPLAAQSLAKIPKVEAHSLLDLYRRTGAAAEITPPKPGACASSRPERALFRRAGLLGDHYFGIALELRTASPAERDRALKAIDSLALPLEKPGGPVHPGAARRVSVARRLAGAPDRRGDGALHAAVRHVLDDAGFIIYRSWRALAAIVSDARRPGGDRDGTG
jgi:hypothetical protein